MTKEITADEINMMHDGSLELSDVQEFDGKMAVLECMTTWTIEKLDDWLPGFDYDTKDMIKKFLTNYETISYGGCLKIWID